MLCYWVTKVFARFMLLQVMITSEGYKGIFIAHCHDEHDSYAELNVKEYNPDFQKAYGEGLH